MNIPDFELLNSSRTEPFFKKNYFEFWKYLNDNYLKTLKFKENAYWYLHNLTNYPKCKICGNPVTKFYNINVGYREYCSTKCSNSDKDKREKTIKTNIERYGGNAPACSKKVIEKTKQTNLKKYGVESANQLQKIKDKTRKTMYERYGGFGNASEVLREKYIKTNQERYGADNYASTEECRKKMQNTCIERYGVDSYSKTDDFKESIIKHNQEKYGVNSYTQSQEYKDKTLQTNLDKFGVSHYSKTQEYKDRVKQTSNKKYGVSNYSKTRFFLDKQYQTKKTNNTFNTSKIEEDFAKWLDDNGIKYIRQYRSDKYPFNCDFYFPDKDLYFEVQGSWVHGGHPYDENDENDLKKLNEWKDKNTGFYDNAIETWTNRDPLKRQIAKENNLNWHEIFSMNLIDLINYAQTNICIS